MKEEDTQSQLRFSEHQSANFATVKLMGGLGKMAGGSKLESKTVQTPIKLAKVLEALSAELGLVVRRDSTLVLINGVEANALQDLDTVIRAGDSIALIPMFHGG